MRNNSNSIKRGLFYGRFQPFHNGHYSVIEQMDRDGLDEIIVGVSSSQETGTIRNPFTAEERREMITQSLDITKKVHLVNLYDQYDCNKWVAHIKEVCPNFDYLYICNNHLRELFQTNGYLVREFESVDGISATKVRQAIASSDNWEQYVHPKVKEAILAVNGVERIRRMK